MENMFMFTHDTDPETYYSERVSSDEKEMKALREMVKFLLKHTDWRGMTPQEVKKIKKQIEKYIF